MHLLTEGNVNGCEANPFSNVQWAQEIQHRGCGLNQWFDWTASGHIQSWVSMLRVVVQAPVHHQAHPLGMMGTHTP